VDLNLGTLYIICVMALNLYGFISSGWASNSKYSFLGSLRAAAQMLGYELMMTTIFVTVIVWVGSFSISSILCAQYDSKFFLLWPLFILFYLGALAETARVPFDLPEAESELVAGYNVEYSSITFAFFFLAEYGNIILSSNLIIYYFLSSPLFMGMAGLIWFLCKLVIILYGFILIRATLPRFRFDQLMSLGWLCFLPLAMISSLLSVSLIFIWLSFFNNGIDAIVYMGLF